MDDMEVSGLITWSFSISFTSKSKLNKSIAPSEETSKYVFRSDAFR